MKKMILLLLAVFVLVMMPTASAKEHNRHDWSHPSYHNANWRHSEKRVSLPFKWHERRDHFVRSGYRLQRIDNREWKHRFPGLQAYRWIDAPGRGFWYHGRRITDAVMFYNASNELVSVGFMNNGAFIFIRDDDNSYENRDTFFFSWLRR